MEDAATPESISSIPQKRPYPSDEGPSQPEQAQQQHSLEQLQAPQLAHPHQQLQPQPQRLKPPREKKDSWRKKEALQSGLISAPKDSGGGSGAGSTGKQTGHNTPKVIGPGSAGAPGLMRYTLPPPQPQDYNGHRAPMMAPAECAIGEFFSVNDHPMNRRGFRYTPCEASKLLPALAYRGTDYEPFTARINFEDMNGQVVVNKEGTAVTNMKGWRMARANIGIREGDWYYECKIVNGIKEGDTSGGHVRVGWARREAPLDAPVGFDAYSYGLRDQSCQKLHMSRPKDFKPEVNFETGDVIGLHISLPSLHLQRELSGDATVKSGDIIRDRVPIRFKNQLWFEHFEYQPTKEFEDLMNPAQPGSKHAAPPRTLPGSFIRLYKNGEYVGTPFEDLYAFLPPASKPLAALGARELDDGTLGYYPAVSVFKGGAVELNFGPDWFTKPPELGEMVRGVWERYDEQIAEDVTYDLVDEVDLLFSTAGGLTGALDTGSGIKEMVLDDE